jgi:DNA-binding NarL/FixJ family response regulator
VPERVWRVFELREEGFSVKRIARNLRLSEMEVREAIRDSLKWGRKILLLAVNA